MVSSWKDTLCEMAAPYPCDPHKVVHHGGAPAGGAEGAAVVGHGAVGGGVGGVPGATPRATFCGNIW